MTAETAMHSPSTACAECHATLASCETKRWLGGKACCDGCSHRPKGLNRSGRGRVGIVVELLTTPAPIADFSPYA
jgi:hypothetical protein